MAFENGIGGIGYSKTWKILTQNIHHNSKFTLIIANFKLHKTRCI